MTLCIGTASRFRDEASYAFLSDTRSLSGAPGWGTISSENADKSRFFPECVRFSAVVAGHSTDGDELLTLCDPPVKKFYETPEDHPDFDLHINDLLEGLRAASRTRMKQIQDHFIAMHSPFNGYDDFLARARASLPEIQYRELWHDIASLDLRCEVIIGGIHSGEAILIKIDHKGNPHWEDQYSVIGTGSAEALAFLAQNEYDENEIRLEDSLMRMIEASRFVFTANNTVGGTSRFAIYLENGTEWDLTQAAFDLMKSKIRLSTPVELGDLGDFLEDVDEDKKGIPSNGEQKATEPADAGNEQPSGPSAGSAEGGDSAPTGGVLGDGTEQP
jgi:hypothetical protein